MINNFLLSLCLMGSATAGSLSDSETSYTGASILQGDIDITFEAAFDVEAKEDTYPYAFFEGNTLYVGNSDILDNSIDAIVEFFWFESSIDRGTDFYVAVIKTRSTPGDNCYYAPWDWARGSNCKLWADEWTDWGEHPVITVEAMTDIEREQGAFRWDWSVPFESYGIDAYSQVTFENKYGIGSDSEGAAMIHGEYKLDEDGYDVEAAGNLQVKGYHSSEYSVNTQYEVTLYEWDVYVDGRADLMAWDMYLNLGERERQSAYHEYFLSIQVEEGRPFTIDNFNFIGNYDIGWYDPFHHELGVTIENMTISQPFYIPPEPETEPEDTGTQEDLDTGELELEEEDTSESQDGDFIGPATDSNKKSSKSGCSTVGDAGIAAAFLALLFLGFRRET